MNRIGSTYRGWEERGVKHTWKAYLESVAFAVGGGALFGWITRGGMELYAEKIVHPPFSPPDVIFPAVWGILYLLMSVSAARIYLKTNSEMRKYALKTYMWQLLFNWTWSIWFFNLQWYGFAFLWLLALAVQVAWMIAAFRELDLAAARLQIPYQIWSFFAAYWNLGVLVLNR